MDGGGRGEGQEGEGGRGGEEGGYNFTCSMQWREFLTGSILGTSCLIRLIALIWTGSGIACTGTKGIQLDGFLKTSLDLAFFPWSSEPYRNKPQLSIGDGY